MAEASLLEVAGLRKSFSRSGAALAALDGVDLTAARGETLALAGASGSGKTTLARCIMRLIEPDGGTIRFAGSELTALRGAALRRVRPKLQLVFQNPLAALNPRATVARILEDPLRVHDIVPRSERRDAVLELLRHVQLPPETADRRPHQLSGGQQQRVVIARAIATRPELIVLDEPVSALDVSVRAQILNLLMDLQAEMGIAYLLITHDLAVARATAKHLAIMHAGRIVEIGPTEQLLTAPQAPVTRALLDAVPRLEIGRRSTGAV